MRAQSNETVLRPYLFSKLRFLFRNVKIINQGQPFNAALEFSPLAKLKKRKVPTDYGETYVVNCPYCNDTRQRLYINHRWGYFDEETETRNWWLVKCFNEEDCLATHEKRMEFATKVFNETGVSSGIIRDVVTKNVVIKPPGALKSAILPGKVTPLKELVKQHPAVIYLESRGYDVEELADRYDISYCYDSLREYPLALNRLIIPVRHNDVLVGWQARLIGDPPRRSVPKYYTMPGFRKSETLYNLDAAKQNNYAVLVEGPADVWRFGCEAVAALGCNVTKRQLDLLANHFSTVVVLLDGDAEKAATDNFNKLRTRIKNTFKVILPNQQDPGDYDRASLREAIYDIFNKFNLTETIKK